MKENRGRHMVLTFLVVLQLTHCSGQIMAATVKLLLKYFKDRFEDYVQKSI